MNLRIAFGMLAAMTVVAAPLGAAAQETRPVGLTARVGIFWPTSGDARREGRTWFTGGLEYRLGDLNVGRDINPNLRSSYSISADYYSKGDFQNFPVMLNYVGRTEQIFYTAGLGVGFGRIQEAGRREDKTSFMYQLGIGFDFQRGETPLFLEAKYWGSSRSELAGFGVYVGARF